MTTDEVLCLVRAERREQDEKWGEQNHPPAWWLAILAEEVGEAAEAMLEGRAFDFVREMTDAAAVRVAAIESVTRAGEELPDITALQREVKELRRLADSRWRRLQRYREELLKRKGG